MTSLRPNLVKRIERLPKPRNSAAALQPLFEAISNSIHSTQAKFGEGVSKSGRVIVTIETDRKKENVWATIEDNGNGLDENNWEAFTTTDTDNKLSIGGKGVGRLLWLDCFIDIDIIANAGREMSESIAAKPHDNIIPPTRVHVISRDGKEYYNLEYGATSQDFRQIIQPSQQRDAQSPAAYASHIQDGNLKTQFAAGDGKGPLGHADFKKEEIGRMLNDPEIKTINGHEVWRYKYNYDKAEYEAQQRGATPEQAQMAAAERTQQVMARVELAHERAELRMHPYTKNVNTHFDKLGQLRDTRVQDLMAQAKREGHDYRGPAPKPPAERQLEARTAAHVFGSYASLDIYAQQYNYSPKVYEEKKTGLDRSIAEYKHRARAEHERSLSGLTREPSIDRSFGPEIGR